MKKYYGIMPVHKMWVRVAVGALGCYIVFRGALDLSGHWYYIPIGIFVVLAVFYWKQYVVSEKGVDVESVLLGIKSHNLWTWDEITSLHTDYKQVAPNVHCHFGKDIVTRTYMMTYEDSQEILKLAVQMNPDIYIDDMNAEKEAELAANAKKYQAKMAAEKAQKKAEKAAKKAAKTGIKDETVRRKKKY